MQEEQEQIKHKKWYKKWWVILIAFLLLILNIKLFLTVAVVWCLWYIWKKTNLDKSVKFILTISILLIYVANIMTPLDSNNETTEQVKKKGLISNTEQTKNSEQETENSSSSTKSAESSNKDFKNQLQREIDGMENFDGSTYKESVTALQLEIVLFSAWASIVNEAEKNSDQEINNLGKELEKRVKAVQVKEFPVMRKSYGEIVNTTLWEHNIDVKVFGTYNNTIELTGALFANNKNIKDTQAEIQEMLQLLRFDRINYKWYKYDDDYTYFNLESHRDNETVEIEF